jgi:hypothetical protein
MGRYDEDANFIIEPKLVNDRALVARSLFSNDLCATVRVLNPSDAAVNIKRWHCIGTAEAIDWHVRIVVRCVCVRRVEFMHHRRIRSTVTMTCTARATIVYPWAPAGRWCRIQGVHVHPLDSE